MIAREKELSTIEDKYNSNKFEFLVMYGRRRVGKTTILNEIAKKHNAIFFSAQEKNDELNLEDFSRAIENHYDKKYFATFKNWQNALDYITERLSNEKRTLLIIDEFPFIASQNPSIKSIFQHTIDHQWQDKNIFLILCGSSVSFMENEVMGYKSPLYGRMTSSIEVKPFDYFDGIKFFPDYSIEDKIISYGILGGIPRYLCAFDSKKSVKQNIIENIIRKSEFLNDEPQTLLRMELREPAIYNSILNAIAGGCNKISEIADRVHEEKTKISKYMLTLQNLRLVEKKIPCGENPESKKAIYVIKDFFYSFWYRFIFSNENYFTMLDEELACEEIYEQINDFMGLHFEEICKQFLIRLAKNKKLPFIPFEIGKWWGNNPILKAQDDVDILAFDRTKTKAIFCECKFRNKKMPLEEFDDLITASKIFNSIEEKTFIFISKSGFEDTVIQKAKELEENGEKCMLMTLEDFFQF